MKSDCFRFHGTCCEIPALFKDFLMLKSIGCILSVATLFLSNPLNCLSGENSLSTALETGVLEELRRNDAGLMSGHLAWTRKTRENEFVPGRKTDTSGEYKLWWDGKKIATEYMQDNVYDDKDHGVMIKKSGERKAFNGIEFREVMNMENPRDISLSKEPKFRKDENWLEIVGLSGDSRFETRLKTYRDYKKADIQWTSNDSLIVCRIINLADSSRMELYFDTLKNCSLTREEWYNPQGKRYAEFTRTLHQVAGDVYFPSEMTSIVRNPDTGVTTLETTYSLRLNECKFNDTSTFPRNIFEIPITPDMEVSDYRSGAKLNYDMSLSPAAARDLLGAVNSFMTRPVQSEHPNYRQDPRPGSDVPTTGTDFQDLSSKIIAGSETRHLMRTVIISCCAMLSAFVLYLKFGHARKK